MNKKTSKEKKSKSTKSKTSMDMPSGDIRATEKVMTDITTLLNEQQFGSIEDAESFLNNLLGSRKMPPAAQTTALQKAQELIYDAFEASGKRRVALARQALELCSDCADAYVILAEETARSIEESKNLYEQGVKAGERALGPKTFKNDAGYFWGILETRPYMRARAGLAQCLWTLGRREEALEHYRDMLRLNPNDNQGIRYILANCLLDAGQEQELEKLLEKYGDDIAATWPYTRALLLYRQEGPSIRAKKALSEAKTCNRFVPLYLLGKKRLPRHLPEYVGIGDENEAIAYVADALEIWRKTPGALDWLSMNLLHDSGN
jgi:tetratricopeptide (TPR) repeat protein